MTLDQIALKHKTDKASNVHGYTKWYEKYFEPMRNNPIVLFEAGYGGYQYPDRGGESARTWREYFPNATIVTVDIYDKTNVPEGVNFHKGNQDDSYFWSLLTMKYGKPDIFISDASHINSIEVRTMKLVCPMVKEGGWYVVEDTHTSYWDEIASDGTDFQGGLMRAGTTIEYAKNVMDQIQQESGLSNKFNLESMHVYDKIIFLKKKE